ncbi:EAL domain-containing protein [Shewanella sp. GXUN23E]|uniref:EAL domain-containing protein n=1 Tax=Shewanella sp. GXUN23E TaxID=3422498 RepID=UPI003D7EB17C
MEKSSMFSLLKKSLCKRCMFFGLNCDRKGCDHYYTFQHIIDRRGALYAVELLSRPVHLSGYTVEQYFDTLSVDEGKKLIKHQLINLARNWKLLNLDHCKIFVNIDRYLLADPNIVDVLTQASRKFKKEGLELVYEITERQYEVDMNLSTVFYRMLLDDILFAADDYSFVKKTHVFADDYAYIKIDMEDIYRGIRQDYNKFIDRLYQLKDNNIKLIAEKVQSKNDYLTIYAMPFDFFQGFYFDTDYEPILECAPVAWA